MLDGEGGRKEPSMVLSKLGVMMVPSKSAFFCSDLDGFDVLWTTNALFYGSFYPGHSHSHTHSLSLPLVYHSIFYYVVLHLIGLELVTQINVASEPLLWLLNPLKCYCLIP